MFRLGSVRQDMIGAAFVLFAFLVSGQPAYALPPTADDEAQTTPEDSPLLVTLTGSDPRASRSRLPLVRRETAH